jgi:hypothetical protein
MSGMSILKFLKQRTNIKSWNKLIFVFIASVHNYNNHLLSIEKRLLILEKNIHNSEEKFSEWDKFKYQGQILTTLDRVWQCFETFPLCVVVEAFSDGVESKLKEDQLAHYKHHNILTFHVDIDSQHFLTTIRQSKFH